MSFLIPTDRQGSEIAKVLPQIRGGQMFSIDRYHNISSFCPPLRTRSMLDDNTYLVIEL